MRQEKIMTKIIVPRQIFDCEHLLGQFVDESHYDILVEEDTDCYLPADCDPITKLNCTKEDCKDCEQLDTKSENKIAFKFRKNFFTKEEQEQAYIGLREAALPTQNRGLAAGPKGEKCGGREWVNEFQLHVLDFFKKQSENSVVEVDIRKEVENLREKYQDAESSRGLVWLSAKVKEDNFNFDQWLESVMNMSIKQRKEEAKGVEETYISDTTYANVVLSGIAGWFDRYPRIPYGRATAYTQNSYDKFQMAFPFLQSLNRGFKQLLPKRWAAQRAAANKIDPAFLVPETVFTTITVNKTFRTACHRDAGDFSDGLSNLLVLSNNGNYSGGYLVFPEVRVAVNVRPGDLLLVNNHEIIHGNTPIVLNDDEAERISLVCYLREGMLDLGSKEYEDIRFNYVESRRKNKEHPLQRRLWNGISPGMWEEKEWYDYLREHGGEEMLNKYHPEVNQKESTLEDLFS
jgi:hypothetical protein